MLRKYLNFNSGEKTFDISVLTKRGVRSILINAYSTVSFENDYIISKGKEHLQFPILNGRLPNNFTLTEGDCDIIIEEFAGEGDRNYWKITKENDNGIPSYRS